MKTRKHAKVDWTKLKAGMRVHYFGKSPRWKGKLVEVVSANRRTLHVRFGDAVQGVSLRSVALLEPKTKISEDPIKVAKSVVEKTTVLTPASIHEVPLKESPTAILAMLNALLNLPAAAEALGGESRRAAWHRMVKEQVLHGRYAQALR